MVLMVGCIHDDYSCMEIWCMHTKNISESYITNIVDAFQDESGF